MTPEELRDYELIVIGHKKPDFSPELVAKWQRLLQERENKIDAKFKAANAHSEKICIKAKRKITARFFEALYAPKAKGVIRGKRRLPTDIISTGGNPVALEAKSQYHAE